MITDGGGQQRMFKLSELRKLECFTFFRRKYQTASSETTVAEVCL